MMNPLTTPASLADDRGMVAVSQFDYEYTRRTLELVHQSGAGPYEVANLINCLWARFRVGQVGPALCHLQISTDGQREGGQDTVIDGGTGGLAAAIATCYRNVVLRPPIGDRHSPGAGQIWQP